MYLPIRSLVLPAPVDAFLKLLKLRVTSCSFSCNNNSLRQKNGLPMDKCLSPVLSIINGTLWERLLLAIASFEHTWFRWVDDIFATITNSNDIVDFLTRLNPPLECIKFKVVTDDGLSFWYTCDEEPQPQSRRLLIASERTELQLLLYCLVHVGTRLLSEHSKVLSSRWRGVCTIIHQLWRLSHTHKLN